MPLAEAAGTPQVKACKPETLTHLRQRHHVALTWHVWAFWGWGFCPPEPDAGLLPRGQGEGLAVARGSGLKAPGCRERRVAGGFCGAWVVCMLGTPGFRAQTPGWGDGSSRRWLSEPSLGGRGTPRAPSPGAPGPSQLSRTGSPSCVPGWGVKLRPLLAQHTLLCVRKSGSPSGTPLNLGATPLRGGLGAGERAGGRPWRLGPPGH